MLCNALDMQAECEQHSHTHVIAYAPAVHLDVHACLCQGAIVVDKPTLQHIHTKDDEPERHSEVYVCINMHSPASCTNMHEHAATLQCRLFQQLCCSD